MMKTRHSSLWRWICGRILALAIGSVMVIATCMWLRFAVQNYWIMHKMPPALRGGIRCAQPQSGGQPGAFSSDCRYLVGIELFHASIASADWVTVAVLVLVRSPSLSLWGSATPVHSRCSSAVFVMRRRTSPGAIWPPGGAD